MSAMQSGAVAAKVDRGGGDAASAGSSGVGSSGAGSSGAGLERIVRELMARLPEAKRRHSEARIETMMELILERDPFEAVETRIDDANAEFRKRFLETVPCRTSAELHRAAGRTGRNTSQTAAQWKARGRVFAVSYKGRDLFPAVQFDADGQPLAIVAEVLAALPGAMTPWQVAGWFMARNLDLDGATPESLLAAQDPRLIAAAAQADARAVG